MSDWDVTIDGTGYMLVPGSYRAMQEGTAGDGRLGRQRLEGFAAGQGHALALPEGGLLGGVGLWPAPRPAGAALGPGPARQAVAGTLNSSEPKLAAADRDYLFIACGTTLFRWGRSVSTAPVNRKTLPASALCLTRLKNQLYLGYGAAADVGVYDDVTNTLSASALGAGVKASLLGTFSRGIALVSPTFPSNLHLYYGNSLTYARTWSLDGRILRFAQHGERMVVATDAGLFILSGDWYQDSDPPAPPETLRLTSWGTLAGQLQDDDDFAWLIVYQGRLLAWLGQRVVVFDDANGWWRPAGLEGSATFGAAVVNGWLLTSISPSGAAGTYQLWGWDGAGWWLLEETATNTLAFPAADGSGKLAAFRSGSDTLSAWDLADTTTAATLASPASLVTPLLDGGEPDRRKRWRRLGVELARPDGQAVGEWSAALDYSADGGTTWTSAGTATSVTGELATVQYPIAVTSAALLVRVTLTRVSGLPPFVTAVWAEYETLDESARRRRWQFRLHARAKGVNRAGAPDPRSGQQIRAALWALWESAASFPFRDIDYATVPTERTTRLTAIREEWPKPADQAQLGADTLLEVTLVEE